MTEAEKLKAGVFRALTKEQVIYMLDKWVLETTLKHELTLAFKVCPFLVTLRWRARDRIAQVSTCGAGIRDGPTCSSSTPTILMLIISTVENSG